MSTSRPSAGSGAADAVREAAALWCDRLARSDVSAETRAAFARWMEESAGNRAAYEAVSRAWTLVRDQSHDPRILALRHETALRLTRDASRRSRTPARIAAALAVLAAGAVVTLALSPDISSLIQADAARDAATAPARQSAERYDTAIGERLAVTLSDGSQVTLNTQTALETSFSAAQRSLQLKTGQALFEVARDATRPFVVEAQGRRLIALGTVFDVRLDGESMQVTMLEGRVRVERTAPDAGQGSPDADLPRFVTTLAAGEQLTLDAQRFDRVVVADGARITSWRHGQVIFENSRLEDAIAELNRYSKTRVELADPALGELRISGAFVTGRPAIFVEALTTYFPIAVERQDEEVVRLGRRP